MSESPTSPSVTASAERLRAEILYEELGGDLCICQRADVSHWCEKCQQRIGRIMSFLNDYTREALTQAQRENETLQRVHAIDLQNAQLLIEQVEAAEAALAQQAQEIARLKEEVQSYVEREAGADL